MRLEDVKKSAAISGVEPGRVVRIDTTEPVGDNAQATYCQTTAVSGPCRAAVKNEALASLVPGTNVLSDGLACFSAVIDADCAHSYIVVGHRKPRDLPQLRWVNTELASLKTLIMGPHKSFKFEKYAARYLGAFNFWFNHRFVLANLVTDVIADVVKLTPRPEFDQGAC
jgi:hypothetical protein